MLLAYAVHGGARNECGGPDGERVRKRMPSMAPPELTSVKEVRNILFKMLRNGTNLVQHIWKLPVKKEKDEIKIKKEYNENNNGGGANFSGRFDF